MEGMKIVTLSSHFQARHFQFHPALSTALSLLLQKQLLSICHFGIALLGLSIPGPGTLPDVELGVGGKLSHIPFFLIRRNLSSVLCTSECHCIV